MTDIDEIKIEELAESQRELAELVGIETYRKLVRYYGGESVYIPRDSLTRPKRNEKIQASYRAGRPIRELSHVYGLSANRIRQIVSGIPEPPLPGQMTLEELIQSKAEQN